MHCVWRNVRRPFRYPKCVKECSWEVYDATLAGCLKCGENHTCQRLVFEGNCPLEVCDDGSRVCCITGYVIPEVRYSNDEFLDTVSYETKVVNHVDLDSEVCKYVDKLLDSTLATQCRVTENNYQAKKIFKNFVKIIRTHKMQSKHGLPNICQLITQSLQIEKRINFIFQATPALKSRCQRNILLCIIDLKNKGLKVCIGNKLQDLVCGLLYLLRTGVSYRTHELLSPIPEIARCLPIESRLKQYFNINSKVITSVENEVKLAFRDFHQK